EVANMTLKRKVITLALAAAMVMAMAISSFAATPSVCKFTKPDGRPLKMGMDTKLIRTVDLNEDGIANVTFKPYSLLWYTGEIVQIINHENQNVYTNSVAKIDMNYDDGTGLPGVPVKIYFKFKGNRIPPGMQDNMDARFVCEP
ncbi:hypothetical protein ACQQ97_07615, partial [Anaerovoracaceae bacterium SGI.195]